MFDLIILCTTNFHSYLLSIHGCTNVTDIAMENSNLAPYALIVGSWEEARQAFLAVDKQEMDIKDVPLVLMSAFFVYNIQWMFQFLYIHGGIYSWFCIRQCFTYSQTSSG